MSELSNLQKSFEIIAQNEQAMQHSIFDDFIAHAIEVLSPLPDMVGLAIAGSHITKETDAFSDLDLVLVSQYPYASDVNQMKNIAHQLGTVLSAFTGEHVGEPRLLICLYANPLLHVDIKFLTPNEFHQRIENPLIVWERDHTLSQIVQTTQATWPYPDYQWIEDRFWVWIHYASLKIGRGELFEAFDFLGFLRMVVLGPLLHIKNGNQPRGVRKVETKLSIEDLTQLRKTVGGMTHKELTEALWQTIAIYEELRLVLFESNIGLKSDAEKSVKEFLAEIEKM